MAGSIGQKTQAAEVSAELVPSSLKAFHATLDTYYKMAEAGLLDQGRYELIHGVILEMQPISPQHAYCVKRLSDQLSRCLEDEAEVLSQHPLQIADDSEPQPDILVVRGPLERYAERHPRPEDILLVTEVAKATLQTDRSLKLKLYASANIPEYWIVNLVKQQLELHRKPDPEEARYLETETLREGAKVNVLGRCELPWW